MLQRFGSTLPCWLLATLAACSGGPLPPEADKDDAETINPAQDVGLTGADDGVVDATHSTEAGLDGPDAGDGGGGPPAAPCTVEAGARLDVAEGLSPTNGGPSLAWNGDSLALVWAALAGGQQYTHFRRLRGGIWGETHIYPRSGNSRLGLARFPDIAWNQQSQTWAIVWGDRWRDEPAENTGIFFALVGADGEVVSDPRELSGTNGYDRPPTIESDPEGPGNRPSSVVAWPAHPDGQTLHLARQAWCGGDPCPAPDPDPLASLFDRGIDLGPRGTYPSIAVGGAGRLHAAWSHNDGSGDRLLAATFDGAGRLQGSIVMIPAIESIEPVFYIPSLVRSEQLQEVALAYVQGVTRREVILRRSRDSDQTPWQHVERIHSEQGDIRWVQLLAEADGYLVIWVNDTVGRRGLYARRWVLGRGMSPIQRIAELQGPAFFPSAARAGEMLAVAWLSTNPNRIGFLSVQSECGAGEGP